MKQPNPQQQIDITLTKAVNNVDGSPIILAEGAIMRKGSRFVLNTDVDPLIPVPVMYDINTKLICLDMLPKELRVEYEKYGFYITK